MRNFKRWDTDSSGTIDVDELLKSGLRVSAGGPRDFLKAILGRSDNDGNGQLSADDLPPIFQRFMDELDKDEDGTLSARELEELPNVMRDSRSKASGVPSSGGQRADPNFEPNVSKATYSDTDAPTVAIDAGHQNFHTREGRYKAFAQVLEADGAKVIEHSRKFSEDSLASIDMLVIANALPGGRLSRACGTGQLGSHVFSCDSCGRTLTGFNRCSNRHCPGCSYQRRTQWHDRIMQWNLNCDYWHIVFTLPHESHPLIRVNLKYMYDLLFRCAADTLLATIKKLFGCQPGLVMMLHSWGQRVKFHVHVHIILTGGGWTLEKDPEMKRWIEFPRDHPALQADALSQAFKRLFLRRLKSATRRSKLLWPETLLAGEVLSVANESLPQEKKEGSLRALTADEQDLLNVLGSKWWMVNVQPTASLEGAESGADGTRRRGPEGIVNYLAKYVSGTAIGNKRLIRDDGQQVTFWYTDYGTGEMETETVTGGEFVQRVSLHILPKYMQRVRYKGLFAAAGRKERLERCRQLIAQAEVGATDANPASAASSEGLIKSQQQDEPEEPESKSPCTCRYCQGQLEVVGRLKGKETLRVKELAEAIIGILPVITAEDLGQLLAQLTGGLLRMWRLARPVQEVIPPRFVLECSPLELIAIAGLLHGCQAPTLADDTTSPGTYISGIPPPDEAIEGSLCGAH